MILDRASTFAIADACKSYHITADGITLFGSERVYLYHAGTVNEETVSIVDGDMIDTPVAGTIEENKVASLQQRADRLAIDMLHPRVAPQHSTDRHIA